MSEDFGIDIAISDRGGGQTVASSSLCVKSWVVGVCFVLQHLDE